MKRIALSILATAATGCATVPSPRNDLLTALRPYCGQAFEGRIVSPSVAADEAFAGKRLVMHVRQCDDDAIRVPFHVGEDRSRTWVISRTHHSLRLKHDHRHKDGNEDRLTQYGGDSIAAPTEARQLFPADSFTKDLLRREGNIAGIDNVWAIEVRPGIFAYELRRPNRFFRVEFDLTRPVAAPPAPWGAGSGGAAPD